MPLFPHEEQLRVKELLRHYKDSQGQRLIFAVKQGNLGVVSATLKKISKKGALNMSDITSALALANDLNRFDISKLLLQFISGRLDS